MILLLCNDITIVSTQSQIKENQRYNLKTQDFESGWRTILRPASAEQQQKYILRKVRKSDKHSANTIACVAARVWNAGQKMLPTRKMQYLSLVIMIWIIGQVQNSNLCMQASERNCARQRNNAHTWRKGEVRGL